MSDETALLRAIAANPDEDTPRLAYADWLDEHRAPKAKGRGKKAKAPEGNPRAMFIRGQVELARLKEDSMHRRELAFRCRQLLDEHEQEWIEQDCFVFDWGWSRGFVESFTAEPVDLVEDGEDLFRRYPFRRLWLWKLNGDIEGVNCIPADNHLTALDLIGNDLKVNQLKLLARMKHLPHLRELGLMFNNLRDTSVKVLCGEEFFQRLDLIRLGANPFTDRGRDQLRKHFGQRVTFAHEREPERLYTIQNDYLSAGWGADFTQLFISATESGPQIAFFDHAGNLLRTEERQVEYPANADWTTRAGIRETACDKWLKEIGYKSATIKVKAFRLPDGAGLTPFNWWAEERDKPDGQNLYGSIEHWLEAGKYRYYFGGDDAWFDRTGEVTDT